MPKNWARYSRQQLHPGAILGDHLIEHHHRQAAERGIEFDAVVAEEANRSPLCYIPTAAEIAGAAVFFASELSRAITGQLIIVDGDASL